MKISSKLEKGSELLKQEVTERKQAEHALRERYKELAGLYGVSQLVAKPDISIDEVLKGTVDLIPPSWQYPEITCARITFDDKEFKTDNFMTTVWKQSANIQVKGKKCGSLEVYYLEEKPKIDEGPFLKEERALIKGFARILSEMAERKKVEETLRKEREFSENLIKSSFDGILAYDLNCQYLVWNPGMETLSGMSSSEVLGKVAFNVFPFLVETGEDKYMKQALKGRAIIASDRSFTIPETGREGWFEAYYSPLYGNDGKVMGGLGIVREITKRKEAEEALKNSEERLKVIFEDAPDAIYLTDLKGNCLDGNKAAEDMLGYKREELIGKNLFKLKFLSAKDLPKAMKNLAINMLGRKTEPDEFLLNRKDGGQIPVEISTFPTNIKKKPVVLGIARDISERKQAENELKESEVRYKMLSDLSKEGIAIHYKGVILDCNKAFCDIFGYEADEIMGTNVIPKVFTPESQEKALRNIKAGFTGSYVYRGIKKDRTLIWVEVESRNMTYNNQQVRQTTVRDITDRKKAEERLRKSEASLIEAQRMTHIGSWDLDLVSNTLTWSDEVYRIFGLEPQQFEATYKAFLDNIHQEDRDMVNKAYNESVKNRNPYNIVHRLSLKDGTVKYVNEQCETFYDGSGKPIRSAGTVQDITERKRTEELDREIAVRKQVQEELLKINTELAAAISEANLANQAKSDFLANMSHELRTPLNAVIGFSDVLQEQYFGKLNKKQEEYVGDIRDSGKHLLSLINDILDLSKIEAGQMGLELSGVRIKELVENSLVMIKEKVLKHGINLDMHTTDLAGIEIMADERRLKQVMFNLLSNAAKFTPDGGTITVEGWKDDNGLTISISDTGIGIAPEEQGKIFEEFYQTKDEVKGKTQGTGLGLPITKRIIDMHGGKIWVESEGRNKGSRFTFTLPTRSSPPIKAANVAPAYAA